MLLNDEVNRNGISQMVVIYLNLQIMLVIYLDKNNRDATTSICNKN